MIYKLLNPLKNYAWGSQSYLQDFLGIPPGEKPGSLAELWMGAHPSSPSKLLLPNAEMPLDTFISSGVEASLGNSADTSAAKLPYLFKVLAVAAPLSIQVHPTKAQAEAGYLAEEEAGIALDDPTRNYKDNNHKPELIYALSPFRALCGIRDYRQIIELGTALKIGEDLPLFDDFARFPNLQTFRTMLISYMQMPDKTALLTNLLKRLKGVDTIETEIKELVFSLHRAYPNDPGLIFALFLIYIKLAPGEAIYLEAGILHAYLEGAGLELMASSDNVIRAGLTPKHVDLQEFAKLSRFEPYLPPILKPDERGYLPSLVPDFRLRISDTAGLKKAMPQPGIPRIILCLEGSCRLNKDLVLQRGESAFVTADEANLCVSGNAILAIAEPGNIE